MSKKPSAPPRKVPVPKTSYDRYFKGRSEEWYLVGMSVSKLAGLRVRVAA